MKVIIIGGGEIGFFLAERLSAENKDVVLIESDAQRAQLAKQELDIQVIHGQGSSPNILNQAGIEHAEMVVAVTTSDEVNMIACLIASAQSTIPIKVARIRNLEYVNETPILGEEYLGIDCHINPEMEAAESIIKLCQVPAAGNVLDLADDKLRMISVRMEQCSGLCGHKLKDLPEFHPNNKVLICAVERSGKTVIPTGMTQLAVGDKLWLIAPQEKVQEILSNIGVSSNPIRRAMVFGSTITTRFVAERLAKEKIDVKLISVERDFSETMAERLDALVLHVPSISVDMLKEENIEDFSAFIATGRYEEDNILASLLAKRLGVRKAITLLEKPTYNSLISAIGVDNVVNRRMAAADKILQYIRRGRVQSTFSIGQTGAEAIDFEALETSDVVGKPLHTISFPKGALVAGILRNGSNAIIPKGNDVIEPGDRVVVVALRHAIPKVEKLFQVKMNFF